MCTGFIWFGVAVQWRVLLNASINREVHDLLNIHAFYTIYFNLHFNVLSNLHLSFLIDLLARSLQTISHMHAKCPAHHILFDSKSIFPQPPLMTYVLMFPHFSNIFNPYTSLTLINQVLHSYKTKRKIVVQ